MAWSVGSLLRDPFLSASGASVWAMAGNVAAGRALDALRIAGARRRAAIAWAALHVRRARDLWLLSAFGAFSVHAYATLAVSVHENHLFAAVPLLALASAGRARFIGVFVAASAIVTLNLHSPMDSGVGVRYGTETSSRGSTSPRFSRIVNLAALRLARGGLEEGIGICAISLTGRALHMHAHRHQQAVENRLRARRAPGNIHIHLQDAIDTADRGVGPRRRSHRCTGTAPTATTTAGSGAAS
jgi:hypothetical protein